MHPERLRYFAFVAVSQIGELSRSHYVGTIREVREPEDEAVWEEHPGRAAMDPPSGPELPYWLPGYDAPYEYVNITGDLNGLVIRHQLGESVDLWTGLDHRRGCFASDGYAKVEVWTPDAEAFKYVEKWIPDNGGRFPNRRAHFVMMEDGIVVLASIPYDLRFPLSELEHVTRVHGSACETWEEPLFD